MVSNTHAITRILGSDQIGVFLLYIVLEIHHSGREPLIYTCKHTKALTHKSTHTHAHVHTHLYVCSELKHTHTHNTQYTHTNTHIHIPPPLPLSDTYRGFLTRMVYLYYISCLRYTILVGNPQIMISLSFSVILFQHSFRKES